MLKGKLHKSYKKIICKDKENRFVYAPLFHTESLASFLPLEEKTCS